MNQEKPNTPVEKLEKALSMAGNESYEHRLYVSGQTVKSVSAIENLKQLGEEYLKDRRQVEIIDIYQEPERLEVNQIIGAPTLIKALPPPLRKIVGDLSDKERVLVGLTLREHIQENQE
ncbi:MAG: circadian clock KaiB family protein [Desulfomonilaceae bacterium]